MAAPLSPLRIPTAAGSAYAVRFASLAEVPLLARRIGLGPGRALVVTDDHVAELYLDALCEALETDGWTPFPLIIPHGEGSKSIETYRLIADWALGLSIDRETPVIALGGGVVGDVAGFAAATLLRGLPLVHVPTTVVAQVDSALGGKTGINHPRGKNLLGAFYPPRLVVSDWSLLRSLFSRDVKAGAAEVVKHGLVADAALARRLDADLPLLLSLDAETAPSLLRDAAAVKARIVAADEHEAGQRALLNFGHTFGHAIEKVSGMAGAILHGEAVALGMKAALHLSASLAAGRALAPDAELPLPFAEAAALVDRLRVKASIAGQPMRPLIEATGADKKRLGGAQRYIVLDGIGEGRVAENVPDAMVEAAWASIGATSE